MSKIKPNVLGDNKTYSVMRPFRNSSESSSVNLLMYFRVPRTLFSRQSFMSIFKKKWMKTRNYLISGLGFPKMLPAVTNRWQNLQFYNRRKKSSGLLRSTRWGGYEGRRSSKRSLACCRIQVCAFLCQTFSDAVQAWKKVEVLIRIQSSLICFVRKLKFKLNLFVQKIIGI